MPARCFLLNTALVLGLSGAARVGVSEDLAEPGENPQAHFVTVQEIDKRMSKAHHKKAHSEDGCVDCYQGDIVPPGGMNLSSFLELGSGVRDIGLWPDQTVYFEYTSDMEDEAKDVLELAMHVWEARTCIKFKKPERVCGVADTGPDCSPVFMSAKGDFSKSSLGYEAHYKQQMNLGKDGWDLGSALHQLGHIIGLSHELERTQRDKWVTIMDDNIREEMKAHFKVNPWRSDVVKDLPYDLGSIMHYGEFQFSDDVGNSGSETVLVKAGKDAYGNCKIGQRSELSTGDILTVNALYGCSAETYCMDLTAKNKCDTFKKSGSCANPELSKGCAKTCGVCTCQDKSEDCKAFAESGGCGFDYEGAKGCAKSCGHCEPSEVPCEDNDGGFKFDNREFTCQEALQQVAHGDVRLGCDHMEFQQNCPWTCGTCPAKPFCF